MRAELYKPSGNQENLRERQRNLITATRNMNKEETMKVQLNK